MRKNSKFKKLVDAIAKNDTEMNLLYGQLPSSPKNQGESNFQFEFSSNGTIVLWIYEPEGSYECRVEVDDLINSGFLEACEEML